MLDQLSACRSEHERLQLMFEHAPGFMALLEGPEHRIALANDAFVALVGRRELIGKPLAEALPEFTELPAASADRGPAFNDFRPGQ